jgi:RNase adapter protein RapZ
VTPADQDGGAAPPSAQSPGVRVVVVTGLSGAGKSTALHALEDLGYFCVDNLPSALIERTLEVCEAGGIRRVALGVDVRVGSFLEGAAPALERIAGKRDMVVLFLDASDEIILRRYSESRRPHPLTTAASGGREGMHPEVGAVAVLDGIHLERERLATLRAVASMVIDSTLLSVHDLRRQVIAHLGPGKAEQPRMVTRVVSFGFKYGLPVDADLVFDVRLLDNPFFVPDLRHLPGTDPLIRAFVMQSAEAQELVDKTTALLAFALPRYEREGKSYLTVAVGCTGGRHRSVAVAAVLAERLRDASTLGTAPHGAASLPVVVFHRDVARADMFGSYPPARGSHEGAGT